MSHYIIFSKHVIYPLNAIRHVYNGAKALEWLDALRPAIKVAVDSWVEWDSLYYPGTNTPHRDKDNRNPTTRIKEELGLTSTDIVGAGENAASGYTGAPLYEFRLLGGWWTSDGGSTLGYEGKHKATLVGGSNTPNAYQYFYQYSSGAFSGQEFLTTRNAMQ